MKDFLNAAFPWVAGGIVIAVILTYGNSMRKKRDDKRNKLSNNI